MAFGSWHFVEGESGSNLLINAFFEMWRVLSSMAYNRRNRTYLAHSKVYGDGQEMFITLPFPSLVWYQLADPTKKENRTTS